MSDPLRTDTSRALDAAPESDPDAKIEQLLLTGLDHYFAAQYEQAINVWTRALFLDRSHARALAYIERARSALAERLRESEELLHSGVAAFHRGEGDEARRLLEAAMHQGGPTDEALSVLDRLNRLEQGTTPATSVSPARAGPARVSPHAGSGAPARRLGLFGWAALLLAATGAAFFVAVWSGGEWRSMLNLESGPAPSPAAPAAVDAGLPLPRRGETALERARALAASGRLRDALAALDLIRPTDAQKADADRLRAAVQRQLIGLASGSAAVGEDGNGRVP